MVHADFYSRDLQRLGRVPILGGSAVIRNNAVSTGVLDVNGNSPLWRRFETDPRYQLEGGHVAVYDGKTQVMAGKLKSYNETNSAGVKDVELHFECHLSYVHGMITVPSPERSLTSQTVRPYYRESGPAETVIKDAVRSHVGQDARAENRSQQRIRTKRHTTPPLQHRSQRRSTTSILMNLLGNLLRRMRPHVPVDRHAGVTLT